MNCPHCHEPIDPALIRKAVNAEAGSHKRPGAKGLVRNPKGRPKAPQPTGQLGPIPAWGEMMKNTTKLTPEEGAAWVQYFTFAWHRGDSQAKSNAYAWKQLRKEFPRLLAFEGCEL